MNDSPVQRETRRMQERVRQRIRIREAWDSYYRIRPRWPRWPRNILVALRDGMAT